MSKEKLIINGNLFSIIIFAIIIRLCVSLHSYSGENKPPMFGDYEAQRHWMEITVNLEPQKWYFNSSDNDLLYWGLDYPPLTAYHSYINGKIANYINPEFVTLLKSRGFESYEHKFFMRMTVLVADVAAYFIPVVLVYRAIFNNSKNFFELKHGENSSIYQMKSNLRVSNFSVTYLAQIAITLLYPGLILIDHGHFQYNSVSLGLTIYAIYALQYNKFVISAFLFCLALNYKQMSLYHSLPFFVYMLRKCLYLKKPFLSSIGFRRFVSLSLTVITTFGIIWFPFLDDNNNGVTQVIRRLFPLSRRIFEDKVSNFWCVINLFYKLNVAADQIQLAKICIALVLLTSIPSLLNLFKNSTILRFLLCLINVSLSFYLFSFQVHEKSILLVSLPVLLYFPYDPFPCFWFLIISSFSMLPLLLKDNLLIPFIFLSLLFGLFVSASADFQFQNDRKLNRKMITKKYTSVFINLFKLSIFGCIILVFCSVLIKSPKRYPDLWSLLVSIYSFGHFFLFALYFNIAQIFQALD